MTTVNRSPIQRDALIEQIRARLTDSGCAVLSAGEERLGIGLTTLIGQYTRRFAKTYHGGVVRLRCHAEVPFRVGLLEVAKSLQYPERFVRRPNDPLLGLTRWMQQTDDWLVILDDVAIWEALPRIWETRGRGHLIVVSHSPAPPEFALPDPVIVPKLSAQQTGQFMKQRLSQVDTGDRQHVDELLSQITPQPLTLELVTGIIRQSGGNVVRTVERLQEALTTNREATSEISRSSRDVTCLVKYAINQIQQQSVAAVRLLEACAYLDSERIAIPLLARLLSHHLTCTHEEVTEGLALLDRWELVQADFRSGLVNVHPQIQAVVLQQLSHGRAQRAALPPLRDGMLHATDGSDGRPPLRDEVTRRHVDVFCSHLSKAENSPETARLLGRTASLCQGVGATARAISLSKVAARLNCQFYGEADPRTVKSLTDAADLYAEHQQFRMARRGYRQAIGSLQQTAPVNHAQLFDLLSRLAETELSEGLTGRVRSRLRQIVGHFEKIRRPTSGQRAELAVLQGGHHLTTGHASKAVDRLEDALRIQEQSLAGDDPAILKTRTVLARVYFADNRLAKAERVLQADLRVRMQSPSVSESDVAVPAKLLGELFLSQGRFAEAEPLFRRLYQTRKETLGSDHRLVGEAANHLAVVFASRGNYAEAEPMFRETITIVEENYGESHPELARVYNDLAEMLYVQGNHAAARRLLDRALLIQERRLRANDPQIARTRNNLAAVYMAYGAYKKAEAQYQKDLTVKRQCSSLSPTAIATALNNLGDVWRVQGRYTDAERVLREALELRESVLGEDHPVVAQSLSNLGYVLLQQRLLKEAEDLFERSLSVRRRVLEPQHPHIAATLGNLGETYLRQGRFDQARGMLNDAVEITRGFFGDQAPQLAQAYTLLAQAECIGGSKAKAELLLLKARKIQEKKLTPTNRSRARTLAALAELHLHENKTETAAEEFEASLAIYRHNPGCSQLEIADILLRLGQLSAADDRETAERYLRECLSIREQVHGSDHSEVGACLSELGGIRLQQGDDAEAESLLLRAQGILSEDESNLYVLSDVLGRLAEVACRKKDPAKAEQLLSKQWLLLENLYGSDDERIVPVLNQLAGAYYLLERYFDAEPLIKRSLSITEAMYGTDHPETAKQVQNLAGVYVLQRRFEQAEPLLKQAMNVFETKHGPLHDDVAAVMEQYVELLNETDRSGEAIDYEDRIASIRGRTSHVLDDIF